MTVLRFYNASAIGILPSYRTWSVASLIMLMVGREARARTRN